jgi:hypothetical protein
MAQSPVVQILTHASGEQGHFAKTSLVETARGIVVIDATLTRTESRSMRARVEALGKTIALRPAHPRQPRSCRWRDRTRRLSRYPIVALPSVERLGRDELTEPKSRRMPHAQKRSRNRK